MSIVPVVAGEFKLDIGEASHEATTGGGLRFPASPFPFALLSSPSSNRT